jgi:hypothetical protein
VRRQILRRRDEVAAGRLGTLPEDSEVPQVRPGWLPCQPLRACALPGLSSAPQQPDPTLA